jgi:hypothetical protein
MEDSLNQINGTIMSTIKKNNTTGKAILKYGNEAWV